VLHWQLAGKTTADR